MLSGLSAESLADQILLTLAYTDQFSFPLTRDEIWQRLIFLDGKKATPKVTQQDFDLALQKLLAQKKIIQKKEWLALFGHQKNFVLRAHRASVAEKKWQEVKEFVATVTFLPWIQAIFVTGSLAMNNTDQEDDLDFMVITKKQRLWVTRVFVLIIASIKGKRRSWQEKKHQGWCLNLWLDENHLAVPKKDRGLYRAYEVVQARPVFGREQMDQNFFAENGWIKEWLPNALLVPRHVVSNPAPSLSLFSVLDMVCYILQRWYMRPHQTSEKVGRGFAFFHPRNTEELIYEHWRFAHGSQRKK